MGRVRKNIFYAFLVVLAGLTQTGCLEDRVNEDGTVVDIVPGDLPDPNTYVCNPLDQGIDQQARDQGLFGQLYYIEPGGPEFSAVNDYITYGTHADVNLFFNRLFVPTRPFDRGFVTESGQVLTAADGSTLYEWFAIRFESQLHLREGQAPGRYQLAVLSDDGAVMRVGPVGDQQVLLDNDGTTPTRLRCATEAVELEEGMTLPFTLDYYQGPRYHIALTLLWRPWPASPADVVDPLCNKSGNDYWFDSTKNPPKATSKYNALLSRGWEVIAPENFRLPESQIYNPCNEPAPAISNLNIPMIGVNSVIVTWDTDRPATSQVQLTEVVTGVVTTTPLDLTFVENHSVQVTGLKANTQYLLKAISKSISGRSTESEQIVFRTSR